MRPGSKTPINLGPGTMRVGQFIGRLGVVSLPAIGVGLDIDERVVRRHVSKLEAACWLGRMPWIWGEGSVVWLTGVGTEAVRLGGVRPIKAPPSNTLTDHAVLVGWSAARLERRGRVWKSARELAGDSERWAVRTRCERGYTTVMPDLVGWVRQDRPIAVIAESGFRREDRQKWILEGWRDAISSGLYAGVRYDCASESVAGWINRLAKKVWLTGPAFSAQVQPTAEQIANLGPAPTVADADEGEATATEPTREVIEQRASAAAPRTGAERPQPTSPLVETDAPTCELEASDADAERERILREVLGYEEPKRRRRFRR